MTVSRRLIALLCAAAVLGAAAATAAPALAAGNPIINECSNSGQLTHTYTLAQLRHALHVLPAQAKEYTSCSDVIQNAILAALGKPGPGGTGTAGSGGSFLPTPVIVILVVLILAGVTFGAIAVRRRRAGIDDGQSDAGTDEPGGGSPTRVMPSVPPRPGGGDTAQTQAMPALPLDEAGEGHDAGEAPTRVDEPRPEDPAR